jgi:hypothetical protein
LKREIERVGEIKFNNKNDKMTILEYITYDNIIVLFENGLTKKTDYNSFKKGNVSNPINSPKNRLNEEKINKFGDVIKIIAYHNANDIIVSFENGYIVKTDYGQFKEGSIRNPYTKTLYNAGYIGEGAYIVTKSNEMDRKRYNTWHSMIERCYSKKYQEKFPTYIGCIVCEEWHNYQVFCRWFDKNYYEIDNYRMELDKDILHKGNKIYSPENCVFISNNINTLFTKRNSLRGEYPIGVHLDKKSNNLRAQCRDMIKDKKVWLGNYDTELEAFNAYKTFKERHIKEVADLYKDKIPQKLYEALYRYEVEITD